MTFAEVQRKMKEFVDGERKAIDREDREVTGVVWSGGELLPARATKSDDRFKYMPTLDEGDDSGEKRRYVRSGKYNAVTSPSVGEQETGQ